MTTNLQIPDGMDLELAQHLFDRGFLIFRDKIALEDEEISKTFKNAIGISIGMQIECCTRTIMTLKDLLVLRKCHGKEVGPETLRNIASDSIFKELSDISNTLRGILCKIEEEIKNVSES